jgi:hypothetical protein
MPRDESFDAEFEKVQRQLQEAILNNYPNPQRRGCPGDAALKELATGPFDPRIERDPRWQHVTHCSECYREFLGFRAEVTRGVKVRRARIVLTLGVAVLILVVATFFVVRKRPADSSKRRQNAELAFRRRVVDLQGRDVTRSEHGREETKPIVLQREPEELDIQLPFGSTAGPYEVQIVRSAGHPLLSAAGVAKIENGTTALAAKIDLSRLEPGNYFICVRRVPWDWTCYPIVVD